MKSVIIALIAMLFANTSKLVNNIKSISVNNNQELQAAGKLLYPNHEKEFDQFYPLFIQNKSKFLSEYKGLLEDYDNFELKKLKALEVIFIFGDSKELLWLVDWRGEENEMETENFINNKLQVNNDWKTANEIRKGVSEEEQRDGQFIMKLFKAVDQDLKTINKRLIFLNLGWDSYVFTVVDQASFTTITSTTSNQFYGVEALKQ